MESQLGVDDAGRRLEFQRSRVFTQALIEPSHGVQVNAIRMVSHRVLRVEFDGVFVFLLRLLPVPFVDVGHHGQRVVGSREVILQFERLARR